MMYARTTMARTLMPISPAADEFSATAAIALPSSDRFRNTRTTPMVAREAARMNTSCGSTPNWNRPRFTRTAFSPNTDGTGLGSLPHTTSTVLRSTTATPTVLRIQPSENARRRGRTATRSTSVPNSARARGMTASAASSATTSGAPVTSSTPKTVNASIPPIIRKSPWAKFSVCVVENVT